MVTWSSRQAPPKNHAHDVFLALWLQNIWFCVFSRISIKSCIGRMKCFARWLPDFPLVTAKLPEERPGTWHPYSSQERRPHAKMGSTLTLAVLSAPFMRFSTSSGASTRNNCTLSFAIWEEIDFSVRIFCSCTDLLLSENSGGKGMPTRSMACRNVGRGRSFDKGLLLITFFSSQLPLPPPFQFVDSVSLSGSHSLFLCLPVSLSLIAVHLIMVLVCSSRAWHPN